MQITRTTPFRRMIRQFSQIRLTDARTFIASFAFPARRAYRVSTSEPFDVTAIVSSKCADGFPSLARAVQPSAP